MITLAGYLAPDERWRQFEVHASSIYEDFGITVLHTKDFRSSRGAFKGWSRDKKQELIVRLFEHFSESEVSGVSVSITNKLSKDFKRASTKNSGSSALGMAAGILFSKCCSGSGIPLLPKNRNVRFFIEKGNKNNAQIMRDFRKLKSKTRLPFALGLTEIEKNALKAIQLADFWALYSRRLASQIHRHAPSPAVNPTDFVEPELSAAIERALHSLDIFSGPVTQPVCSPDLVSIGKPNTIWLSPKRT